MARKSFLYYLFSKDKAPLYVDAASHVQEGNPGDYSKPDGQPARLQFSPDGWKDTLVKYARNTKYWGLFRDFSVPMKFVNDGARILRDRMWMFGVEAICFLGIAKFDRGALPYTYTSWYMSELDFTKYKQTRTGVNIQAVEGGLTKLIKSNENTVYEIPISNDLEKFYVEHDGLMLTEKANFSMVDGLEIAKTAYGTDFFLPLTLNNREGHSSGITFRSQDLEDTSAFTYAQKLASTNWFADASINNTATVNVPIIGTLYVKCTQNDPGLGLKIRFLRSNLDIANQNDYQVFLETPLVNGTTYAIPVNITLPLAPGERGYVEGIYGTGGIDIKIEFVRGSDLSATFDNRAKLSYIEALYPSRVLEKLVGKLTNNLYLAQSSFIDSKTDIALTSGNAIRGISGVINPNVLKTSLTDFFKAFGIFSIGLTVKDNKLIIEPLSYFFQNSIITDLGEVDDVEIDPAEDLMFNVIRAGGKEVEYNDVNGKIEFNQGQMWEVPVKKVIKELDLRNPYRTDPIGIELLRINYEGLTTTDAKDDGEVFMLNIETVSQTITQTVDFFSGGVYMTNPGNYAFAPGSQIKITGSVNNNNTFPVVATGPNIVQFDPVGPAVVDETGANITIEFITGGIFKLNRPAYTMTGIPAAMQSSIYNIMFSGKRAILANGPMIRSACDLLDAELIKFTSADKNAELSTTLAGVTITEKADIQIGGLGDKLFKPYYITVRTKVPINVIELINANPFGKIKFTYNGTVFYGFLWDGGIAPSKAGKDNDAQVWKLLSAPENDMRKFNTN